jgi:hypothetical protein
VLGSVVPLAGRLGGWQATQADRASDGAVFGWGTNRDGAFGNGLTAETSLPVQATGITEAAQITGGSSHTCVMTRRGRVYCFGQNDRGQLGDGTLTARLTPTRINFPL